MSLLTELGQFEASYKHLAPNGAIRLSAHQAASRTLCPLKSTPS